MVIVATGFYTGYLPRAPGTWGTILIGLPLCIGTRLLGHEFFLLVFIGLVCLSVFSSAFMEKMLEEKDPSCVVIDEISGFFAAMAFIPLTAVDVISACALFRLFDIVKPYPIGWIEKRFPGGWGITLDDILAGLYANILIQIIGLFLKQ